MGRTQFTFYESFFKAIRRIRKKQDRAEIYDAICAYALYGEEPDLEKMPDAAALAFDLIRPNLDAGRKKASSGKVGGEAKQEESKTKANVKQTESKKEKEKEGEKEKEKEKEKEREKEDECPPPMSPSPGGTPTCGPQPPGEQPKPVVRHKHGQYGWVQLSDEEYSNLLCSLGETELNRCITYVDESAQSNGNKNRWKDWNLVIRKCHREGWGLKQYGRRSDTGFETGNPFAEMLEEELRKRG